MGRRCFSREFKLEAVRLVRERGVSVAQAARDLDLHQNTQGRAALLADFFNEIDPSRKSSATYPNDCLARRALRSIQWRQRTSTFNAACHPMAVLRGSFTWDGITQVCSRHSRA